MNILVTGASGTLGRVVCKQLYDQGHEIIAYSRDPSRQLRYCAPYIRIIGDIQDQQRLKYILKQHNVGGVVHTAALKHVDICEQNPSLAIASVLEGTESVLKAIEEVGDQITHTMVVSSDKACQRHQVYGMCKYLTERLVWEYSHRLSGKIQSIRFGNLFGSEGSVIPIWSKKIEQGHDIQLRLFDGEPAIRFGMTTSHASECLIRALFDETLPNGTFLCSKDVSCINMELCAKSLVDLKGKDKNIQIIKVKALFGESQHEMMYNESEAKKLIDCGYVHAFGESGEESPVAKRTQDEIPMDYEQTRDFIATVLTEGAAWM